MDYTEKQIMNFWAKVDTNGPLADFGTRCWFWTASCYPTGYAHLNIGRYGKTYSLYGHRVAWELRNGRPPAPGMHIDHLCRNPRCVNPDHLEEVTPLENYTRAPRHVVHGHQIGQGRKPRTLAQLNELLKPVEGMFAPQAAEILGLGKSQVRRLRTQRRKMLYS